MKQVHMRYFTFMSLLLSIGIQMSYANGLEREDIFLNDKMEVVSNEKSATYTGTLTSTPDGHFLLKVYRLTGELRMEGVFLDKSLQEAQGQFIYYHANGQIESMGEFRNGLKYGIWQRFDQSGMERAEKVYALEPVLKALEIEP